MRKIVCSNHASEYLRLNMKLRRNYQERESVDGAVKNFINLLLRRLHIRIDPLSDLCVNG